MGKWIKFLALESEGKIVIGREWSLGNCEECGAFTYRSTIVGISQEERGKGQTNDHEYSKRSFNSSFIREEDSKGDVWWFSWSLPKWRWYCETNSITSYPMKVMNIHDELAVVGEKDANAELVNMELNGFSAWWEPFVKGVCARENVPNYERLRDYCIQEETQMELKANKNGGDDNLALFG